MQVPLTRQKPIRALRYGRQRFSSSGALRLSTTVNRSVVNVQPSFKHHLFPVALAEQNNLSFKMTPFEQFGSVKNAGSFPSAE
jgi:hypothetical protein